MHIKLPKTGPMRFAIGPISLDVMWAGLQELNEDSASATTLACEDYKVALYGVEFDLDGASRAVALMAAIERLGEFCLRYDAVLSLLDSDRMSPYIDPEEGLHMAVWDAACRQPVCLEIVDDEIHPTFEANAFFQDVEEYAAYRSYTGLVRFKEITAQLDLAARQSGYHRVAVDSLPTYDEDGSKLNGRILYSGGDSDQFVEIEVSPDGRCRHVGTYSKDPERAAQDAFGDAFNEEQAAALFGELPDSDKVN
jgi:hypothetical protein